MRWARFLHIWTKSKRMRRLCCLLLFCFIPSLTGREVFSEGILLPITSEPVKSIQNDLVLLDPTFRNRVIRLIANCSKGGYQIVPYETVRNITRQDSIFNKKPRRTNLRGGESKHQYGLAIDFVVNNKKMKRSDWLLIGREGEKLGLRWGGRWKRPYDPGHFEWPMSQREMMAGVKPLRSDTVLIPI